MAVQWLKLAPEGAFDAAVYFDSNDTLQTVDRNGIVTEFDCSVYRDNLNRCLVYLDDMHTRGTDLKFPLNWLACVTLSGDITRDKTVQSCMRMRQLGRSQKICFMASYEADIRLRNMCKLTNNDDVKVEHVLQFITFNSNRFVELNMSHWTAAALNYTKKLIGHKLFGGIDDAESMRKLYDMCVENEHVKLIDMYGDKGQAFLTDIAYTKFSNLCKNQMRSNDYTIIFSILPKIQQKVTAKLLTEAPNVRQFTHALDEEQQKEIEQEQESEEERQSEQSFTIKAAKPEFNERLKIVVENGVTDAEIAELKTERLLYTIADSLSSTQMADFCQRNHDAWPEHLLVTKDFKTVIEGDAIAHDEYLRPVMWVIRIARATGHDVLVFSSSHECNQLLPALRKSENATLFMYRPRLSQMQSNLLNDPGTHVTGKQLVDQIDITNEVHIGIYAGSMYFASDVEQKIFCNILGLIPSPRSDEIKQYLDGTIKSKGFVPTHLRLHAPIAAYVGQCKFNENPVDFAIKLIEAQHQSLQKDSHVAAILERGKKMNIDQRMDAIKRENPDDEDDDL